MWTCLRYLQDERGRSNGHDPDEQTTAIEGKTYLQPTDDLI